MYHYVVKFSFKPNMFGLHVCRLGLDRKDEIPEVLGQVGDLESLKNSAILLTNSGNKNSQNSRSCYGS
jgi:hypothetical protein